MKDYTTRCEICDVNLKDTKTLQPVLVSFPHGTLLANEVSRLSCTVCCHKSSKKRHVAITTDEGNVYVGSRDTLDEQSLTSNVCNTFIAIRNRKTNKIRLVESDNIMLSRIVAKQDDLLIPVTKDAKISEISNLEKYSNLQRSFGSKVKKRQSEQNERYKMDVNTLRDNLLEVVDTVDATHFMKDVLSTDSTLIPRCNRLASTVDNVYQLDDIISKLELESIELEASKVLQNLSNLNASDYTPFFLKNMHQVVNSSNRQQFIQVLLYADCILKSLKSSPNSEMFKKACPFSPMIAKKLQQEFTLESDKKYRWLRPKSMRDKALCHIIILSLLIMNFKLDLKTFEGSTSTPLRQLMTLSRVIGTSSATRDVALGVVELKLPLPETKTFVRKERGPKKR